MPTKLTPTQAAIKAQRRDPNYKKTHADNRRKAKLQSIKATNEPSAWDWTGAGFARAGQIASRAGTDLASGLFDILGKKEIAKRISDTQNTWDDIYYDMMHPKLADIYKNNKVSQIFGTIGSNALAGVVSGAGPGYLLKGTRALSQLPKVTQLATQLTTKLSPVTTQLATKLAPKARKAKRIYNKLKRSKVGKFTSKIPKRVWNQVPRWKRGLISKSLKLGKGALNIAKTKSGLGTIGTTLNIRGNAPEYRLGENDLLYGTDIAGRKNFLQKAQDKANEIFRDRRVRLGDRETHKDYVVYRNWYDMFHNPDKLYEYNPVDVELNPGRPVYYSDGYNREAKPMQVANSYRLKRMQEQHDIEGDHWTSLEHGAFNSSWLGKALGADRANLADGAVFDKDSKNHAIYISPRYNSHAEDKSYSSYYHWAYNSKFKKELERLNYANLKGKAKQDAYNQAAKNAHSYANKWYREGLGKFFSYGRALVFPLADDLIQTAYAAGSRDLLPASSNIASAGTQLVSDALSTKIPSWKVRAIKQIIIDLGVPAAAEVLRQNKTWSGNHPVGQLYKDNYYDHDTPGWDEYRLSGARPPVYAE